MEYDGLLEVKCSGVVIQRLQVTYPVGKKVIFEIEMDQKDPKCLKYPLTCHRAKIRKYFCYLSPNSIKYLCSSRILHKFKKKDGHHRSWEHMFKGQLYVRLDISNGEKLFKAVKSLCGRLAYSIFYHGFQPTYDEADSELFGQRKSWKLNINIPPFTHRHRHRADDFKGWY